MSVISTYNLSIGYGSHTVQRSLTLTAECGEVICLLGQNGCGKSTLLRTLAGLQPPVSTEPAGGIIINGHSLAGMPPSERAEEMALVLTERLSVDTTTVSEIIEMGRYPYTNIVGRLTGSDLDAVNAAIRRAHISEEMLARPYNSLSDGEKQRVLIAKALAQQTPLILLDEPTAHLDLPSRIRTMLLLRQLAHEENKCIIISTHELETALKTADKVWLMTKNGVAVGNPAQMRNDIIREFQLNELGYQLVYS